MKSSNKLPLGQIEKGEDLKKINEKAIDTLVVHKKGDETIYDVKTFKNSPVIQKEATADQHPIIKSQFDREMATKANDNNVVHKTGNETIGDVKSFLKSPESEQDANAAKELIRKSQFDTAVNSKVDKVAGKGLSTNDYTNAEKQKATHGETAYGWGDHGAQGYAKKTYVDTFGNRISFANGNLKMFDADNNLLSNVDLTSLSAGNLQVTIDKSNPSNPEIVFKQDGVEIGRIAANTLLTGTVVNGEIVGDKLKFYDTSSTLVFDIDLSKYAEDSNVVHKTGNETIGGVKTFSSTPKSNKDATTAKELVRKSQFDAGINSKVDKVSGKELVDTAQVNKLQTVEQGAEKNVQADHYELDSTQDSYVKNKEAYLTVQDLFIFHAGDDQMFELDFDVYRLVSVKVNGLGLALDQYNEWHNAVEILDVLEPGKDYVQIEYITPSDYGAIHGIEWDATHAAPEVTKIGNMALHGSLPIQSQMKRCVLQDDGKVAYYLDDTNSEKKADGTPAKRDGTDGQVMVEMPRYWRKHTAVGNVERVLFSIAPFEGAEEIPKMYVSAYKAALNRANGKLSSVENLTADYRGGNNQEAWDTENQFKSQQGKPVTQQSRIDFRNAAKKRGANWYDMDLQARASIAWLITMEYGTRDHQTALSVGPTTTASADWNDFNSRYPLFRCGLTNSLGNASGEIDIQLQDYPAAGQTEQIKVFSYRGIENFYGDIWEWTNGVNILENKYYQTKGKLVSDTNVKGYELIGARPTNNGYIKSMYPGTILAKDNNGASSSTYYTDYNYNQNEVALRAVRFGGSANTGVLAGSFYAAANAAPSHATAYIGSRLCFFVR